MDRIVEQADIIIYHHISRYISIDMCAAQRLCRGMAGMVIPPSSGIPCMWNLKHYILLLVI
jgi:hypothetical protein